MVNTQKMSKSQQNAFIFASFSWLLAAQGGHWMITPHPRASDTQYVFVWLQIAIGLGIAIWQYRKSRAPLKTDVTQ
jgi:hypothetical protein